MSGKRSEAGSNRDALAADYRLVRKTLNDERAMRTRMLQEPRRSAAVSEIDGALTALERIGRAVQVELQERARAEQPTLIAFEDGGADRGDYLRNAGV